MLERIQVKGFKSIREMDIELRPLNVLIGANGSGKSNFIAVFKLLNQIVEQKLQNYSLYEGGADNLLHGGRKTSTEIEIILTFGESRYEVLLTTSTDNKLYLAKEIWRAKNIGRHGEGFEETQLYKSFTGDPLTDPLFEEARIYILNTLKSWRVYHFNDTSDSARLKLTQNLHDNEFLRSDGSNLAAFLYLMRERDRFYYDRLEKIIRLAVPSFDGFDLRPVPLNQDTIMLEWKDKRLGEHLKAHLLSDGTLRFICLATLLMQPNPPSLILIDEPELGLHPYTLNLIVGMLQSVSTKSQIIVATHSVSLVDQVEPEDVIVVERDRLGDGASIFKKHTHAELEDWLKDYTLGELWLKNVLGGR